MAAMGTCLIAITKTVSNLLLYNVKSVVNIENTLSELVTR